MARMLKLNTSCIKTETPWDAEQVLSNALAERALFLENNPRYKPYQVQIDDTLDKAGSAQARMTVLAVLMEAKLIELCGQLNHLNGILLKAIQ